MLLATHFNKSKQLFKVVVYSISGLNSTKSIDLIILVLNNESIIYLASFIHIPSFTGVPVPGTKSGFAQSISKLKLIFFIFKS